MKPLGVCLGLALVGLVGWAIVLKNHEEQVRFMRYIQFGECPGRDWVWAHPHEYGASLLFSVPQPKSVHTGEILWTPLLG
jgi:hypothetical protein